MQYTANMSEMNKNGGKLTIDKIGIKNASIFYGFCSKHDRELFSCIENEPFTGRPDQCLAIAYRTMSRELYGKDASAHLRDTLRSADKGWPIIDQYFFQFALEQIEQGNEFARRETRHTQIKLGTLISEDNFDGLKSIVFEFSEIIPFMFAGAWSPFTDLYGVELQKGYTDEILEQVIVSSSATTTGTMVCVSWLTSVNAPGKAIAEQINNLPVGQQSSAIIQMMTKHIENIFFDPEWHRNLSNKHRMQLEILAASGLDFMGSVPSAPIRLDLDFGLPNPKRSFEV